MIRLLVVRLASSLAAQQSNSASSSNISGPKLPVIDYDACPGKNVAISDVKLVKDDLIYSSPDKGKLVARLHVGEKVTVIAGANVIRQPDRAMVKYVSPADTTWPPLKVGDMVSSYGWHVDGNMVFWAKGVWFTEDWEAVAEGGECGFTSGFGPGGCTLDIIKEGVIEWWVQVKASNGVSGWVLAVRYNEHNRWYRWYGNFFNVLHDQCNLD